MPNAPFVEHWALLYLLSEWGIRLAMLVYVPERRSPAAARAWLLTIFAFPWPGLLLYAIIGRVYLPQRRVDLQRRASRVLRSRGRAFFEPFATRPAVSPQFERVLELIENLGDLPIVQGNQVELLTEYDAAIDRLSADVDAASRHVHLLYYIFADDSRGGLVIAALERAVQRGVKCRVLFDSIGSQPWRRGLRRRLLAAGVETVELLRFRWLRWQLWKRRHERPDLRNHRKIAVIDGIVGYIGSQNLVDARFKPGFVYHDLMARVEGPVVAQLQAVWLTDYFLETERQVDEGQAFAAPAMAGGVAAQVLPSGPGYPAPTHQHVIVSLVHAAQRRIVVTTPYFIPDAALLQALQAAVLRGVEVNLVVPRRADQVLVGLGQRSFYEELLEAGVRIHEFGPGLLHSKHQSFDDEIVVLGSGNVDIRSFLLNAEASLIIYDRDTAARLRIEQERNLAGCTLLCLEDWRERPLLARVAQNLARLVDSLL